MLDPDPSDRFAGLDPHALFAPISEHSVIGLAVSGGADSLALMALAAQWSRTAGNPRVIVYTLDHGLRTQAGAEVRMVVEAANSLGLGARALLWEADKPRSGLQSAARAARYRLIGSAMAEDGASVLATAHHVRDQTETVLMRLAHGSGVSGLAGMRQFSRVEDVTVFRPLLDVEPETLARICVHHGLVPALDPSNADATYERVRWRERQSALSAMGLTPVRVSNFARRMARIDDFARSEADGFWSTHCRLDDLGVIHIDRAGLQTAHAEIAVRILRRALRHAGGGSGGELAPIEALGDAVAMGKTGSRTLEGARLIVRGGELLVFRELGRMPGARMEVPIDGEIVWDGRYVLRAREPGLTVGPADAIAREAAETLVGRPIEVPMDAVRSAPLVTDRDGEAIALGTNCLRPGAYIAHRALT